MAICSKCGAQIADDAKFCNSCGAAQTPVSDATVKDDSASSNTNENNTSGAKKSGFAAIFDTPDHKGEFDPNDINNNKVICVLSYLWILFFLPLVACSNSAYGRFHANQSLVLLLTSIAVGVANGILAALSVAFAFIPVAGLIISAVLSIVQWILGLCPLALLLFGMINTGLGNCKELPIVGRIKLIK